MKKGYKCIKGGVNLKKQLFYLLLIISLFIPPLSSAEDAVLRGTIPTYKQVDSIALSPNTGVAYGISGEEKSVYIFDLNNYLVKNKIVLDKNPRGIAVNPLNNLAYITLDSGYTHHGEYTSQEGFLYIIDSDGNILNTITIPPDPQGIAINPDNNTAVIAIEKEYKLLILSISTNSVTVVNEIILPNKPWHLSLDTDSNRAIVIAGKTDGGHHNNCMSHNHIP
jgi:DNA-binding beta-propeller fold protein YncE